MLNHLSQAATAAVLALSVSQAAMATVVWNEAANGDLSNVNTTPSSVTFAVGSNVVTGQTGKTGSVTDLDYFTFTIPTGYWLSAVNLVSLSLTVPATGSNNAAFIAIQAGSSLTPSTAPLVSDLLGYSHMTPGQVGGNILPAIGASTKLGPPAPAIGFTGPVPAGTYSIWIQDTTLINDPSRPTTYSLDFEITQVPEPVSAALLLTGLAGLGWARRRRD